MAHVYLNRDWYNARMNKPSHTSVQHADPADDAIGADTIATAGPVDMVVVSEGETSDSPSELDLQVESILMSTDHPQPTAKIAQWLGGVSTKSVSDAVKRLNIVYDKTDRSFRIEQIAKGWQITTLTEFADLLAMVHKRDTAARLSPAAMETLAIIAYKQPILRADIEAIRGVASGEVIRGLMERRLVKIAGRAEELGRPMLYGTTKTFLEVFGLASLKDLPNSEELWRKQ